MYGVVLGDARFTLDSRTVFAELRAVMLGPLAALMGTPRPGVEGDLSKWARNRSQL